MKKIILMTIVLSLALVTYSFATCTQSGTVLTCGASSPNWTVNVSKGVNMNYVVEATNFRYYNIATGHDSGDKIYGASQADTKIMYQVATSVTATTVAAANPDTAAATSPFGSGWTAL